MNSAGIWHEIGHQFRNPSGVSGRLMGNVMRAINGRPNKLAIEALGIKSRDRILELGCGPGSALKAMSRLAPEGIVHGLDQSAVMVAQAARRNRAAILAGRVVLHQGRFDRIDLPDAAVDKVLAVNVIYFWIDVPAVLDEIRRVLRPGGNVSIYATDSSVMKNWKFAGPETHRLFDAASLAACLRRGGFGDGDVRVTSVRAGLGVPGLIARVATN